MTLSVEEQLQSIVEMVKNRNTINVQLATSFIGGQEFTKIQLARFSPTGRVLVPRDLMTHALVGPHSETLVMLAELL